MEGNGGGWREMEGNGGNFPFIDRVAQENLIFKRIFNK